MNVEQYLMTEFRQNLQAISSFMGQEVFYDPVHIYANPIQSFANTSQFINIGEGIVRSGSVVDNFYYPNAPGRFWVEFSSGFSGSADGSALMSAVSSVDQAAFNVNSQTGLTITGGVTTARPHAVGFFADLSPNIGLGLLGVSSVAGLTISNINLKITKVG